MANVMTRISLFQSTLPARGATFITALQARTAAFQSTLPARGATFLAAFTFYIISRFQSTLPARGATVLLSFTMTKCENFNPRSPHGERRSRWEQRGAGRRSISIHAPRTGSDPCAGKSRDFPTKFQSTLPARGATACAGRNQHGARHFNPRSPHGERHGLGYTNLEGLKISIHAPRTGSDVALVGTRRTKRRFQSTLPARGATRRRAVRKGGHIISIHAPRTGSDENDARSGASQEQISIHAPRTGSDRGHLRVHRDAGGFQSTLPARGATSDEELDGVCATFQSTLPARGATIARQLVREPLKISIHAPRTGSDEMVHTFACPDCDFNPRSPHGERHARSRRSADLLQHFNPRSPHGERR